MISLGLSQVKVLVDVRKWATVAAAAAAEVAAVTAVALLGRGRGRGGGRLLPASVR